MTATGTEKLAELVAEHERLRLRVIELEAEVAVLRGTLSRRDVTDGEDDQPVIIHDVPPNAPR